MQYDAESVEDYIQQLPEDRKEPIERLRKVILDNLPEGFEETILYGMIGYVVPHSIYPEGYHVDPKLPLSFIGLALKQKLTTHTTLSQDVHMCLVKIVVHLLGYQNMVQSLNMHVKVAYGVIVTFQEILYVLKENGIITCVYHD